MYTVRAGSVAVAGHALDCAACAGMRRWHWTAPNALECADCVGMRWKAPIARLRRIAPFAPNCADCAVCAELRRLRWNSAYSLAHSQYYPVAVAAWLRPRFCSLQFPGSACRARFLRLAAGSSSRSPAIVLQLSVRKINNSGQKLNVVIASHSASFFGERPRISPQLTCSCVCTRNSACTSELFWVCYICK